MASVKNLKSYKKGNSMSGLCWIDPFDFFEFLKWTPNVFCLTEGMKQVRRWFLDRVSSKGRTEMLGIAGDNSRRFAIAQFDKLIEDLFYNKEEMFIHTKEDVYSEKYRI